MAYERERQGRRERYAARAEERRQERRRLAAGPIDVRVIDTSGREGGGGYFYGDAD